MATLNNMAATVREMGGANDISRVARLSNGAFALVSISTSIVLYVNIFKVQNQELGGPPFC